jgi:hypothetical protein
MTTKAQAIKAKTTNEIISNLKSSTQQRKQARE